MYALIDWITLDSVGNLLENLFGVLDDGWNLLENIVPVLRRELAERRGGQLQQLRLLIDQLWLRAAQARGRAILGEDFI